MMSPQQIMKQYLQQQNVPANNPPFDEKVFEPITPVNVLPPYNVLVFTYTHVSGERRTIRLATQDAAKAPVVEVQQEISAHLPMDELAAMRMAYDRLERQVR